jgi:PPOX class probable F420-dependent enzyme
VITDARRGAFADASVGRLATIDAAQRPNIVPICFALEGERVFTAIDAKPKRTRELKRLKNIRARPAVSVLVDHFEEDWSRLWWVVAEGTAEIVSDPAEAERAIDLLVAKYSQYQRARPAGPVIAIVVETWRSWAATPS